jgi:deoxyribonuclease V
MDREELLRISSINNPDLESLKHIQEEIAKRVVLHDEFSVPIDYIGGVDSAYINDVAVTVCVILRYDDLKLIERKSIVSTLKFPYISTYFVFREGPPILEVLSKMDKLPTVLMINSQGILHPTLAGCASHIGILAEIPTIGVTQRILCGSYAVEPSHVGEWVPIYYQRKVLGAYFLSLRRNRPIVISPGNRITLESTLNIVKHSLKGHKFPEPIYLAHKFATEEKARLNRSER